MLTHKIKYYDVKAFIMYTFSSSFGGDQRYYPPSSYIKHMLNNNMLNYVCFVSRVWIRYAWMKDSWHLASYYVNNFSSLSTPIRMLNRIYELCNYPDTQYVPPLLQSKHPKRFNEFSAACITIMYKLNLGRL